MRSMPRRPPLQPRSLIGWRQLRFNHGTSSNGGTPMVRMQQGALSEAVLDEQTHQLVLRSTSEQGVPYHLEDPAALNKIARLVAAWLAAEQAMASTTAA